MKAITGNQLAAKIDALKLGERMSLEGVPEDIYHSSEGLGSTAMKAAVQSMAHFKNYMDGATYSTATLKAFAVGSATHCLVLEPTLYNEKFVTQPPNIKRRAGKEWDAFKQKHAGVEILTRKDECHAKEMAVSVLTDCARFFHGGVAEISYWFRDESGVILKARVDYQIGDAAIDLKTTQSESPEKFAQCVKYDYAIQEELYRRVTGLADMIYIGVCKSAPYSVFACKQGDEVRELAGRKIDNALSELSFCLELDEYPNIPFEVMETELTRWEQERYNI